MRHASIGRVRAAVVSVAALLVVGAGLRAGRDAPRPGLWRAHPELKRKVDAELEGLPAYLRGLEPEAFAANYGKLAGQARSGDANERDRALKAIGNLREMTGLPILAEAVQGRKAGGEDALQAVMSLANWIYDAYHKAGKKPPAKFRPLLGLFVTTLVEAADEPNVRSYCFMAVGSLAGPEWLGLIKDLAGSRHPAVTHWSSWAVGQIEGRCPHEDSDPLLKATYVVPEAERVTIRAEVRRLLATGGEPVGKRVVRYSDGIAHFDGWIPRPSVPQRDRPDVREYYVWRYCGGRVTEVQFVDSGEGRRLHRLWYDAAGRCVLCVKDTPGAAARYAWGDYDKQGLLRRVVRLTDDFEVFGVQRFVNRGMYEETTEYIYDGKGVPYSRTRNTAGGVFVFDRKSGKDRKCNSGSRRWWIRSLERYGLASFYPIPRARFDPRKVRLEVRKLKVDPAIVERQCTGSLTIRNVGPSYAAPVNEVGPYYVLHIHDADGKLLFRAGGSWGSGMDARAEQAFTFDTHSNTLPEAGGRVFLLPKVGAYTLKVTVHPGQVETTLDDKTVRFEVGLRPERHTRMDGI